jgi:hypothetical protein
MRAVVAHYEEFFADVWRRGDKFPFIGKHAIQTPATGLDAPLPVALRRCLPVQSIRTPGTGLVIFPSVCPEAFILGDVDSRMGLIEI